LIENGPKADPLFSKDLDQALSLFFCRAAFGVALFEIVVGLLVDVVAKTGNASMPEEFDAILKF